MDTRDTDSMEDKSYFAVIRKLDQHSASIDRIEDTISSIISKQEKHETRFDTTFEKLTSAITGIDKKLETVIATNTAKNVVWENIVKYIVPLLIAAIAAFWTYDQYLETQLHSIPLLQQQHQH